MGKGPEAVNKLGTLGLCKSHDKIIYYFIFARQLIIWKLMRKPIMNANKKRLSEYLQQTSDKLYFVYHLFARPFKEKNNLRTLRSPSTSRALGHCPALSSDGYATAIRGNGIIRSICNKKRCRRSGLLVRWSRGALWKWNTIIYIYNTYIMYIYIYYSI